MKTLPIFILLAVVAFIAFSAGLHADPAKQCTDKYRLRVIACNTDSQCQTADDDLVECLNN